MLATKGLSQKQELMLTTVILCTGLCTDAHCSTDDVQTWGSDGLPTSSLGSWLQALEEVLQPRHQGLLLRGV